MTRQRLPNFTPDPFPSKVDWQKVRNNVDPDGSAQQHEDDLARLQKQMDKQAGLPD